MIGDTPKPMALVNGRPFICYMLDLLECHGISDVVLAVGYLRDQITEVLGKRHGTIRLHYSIEKAPLGTGGGLRNALRFVQRFPAFALNGDTYLDLDFRAMLRAHQESSASLTIALHRITEGKRYGGVIVKNSRIVGFQAAGQPGQGLINAGVYLFADNFLDRPTLPLSFSFEHDFLEANLDDLRPLAFETDAYFIDIGVPVDYLRAQRDLARRNRKYTSS